MRDERRKTLRKTPRSSRCKVGERDGVACGRGRMRRGWTKLTSRECTLRRCAVVDWIPIDSLKALTDGFVRGERSIETQRKNEAGRGQGLTTCDSSRTQKQAKPGEGKQRKYIDENIDENAWKYLTGTIMLRDVCNRQTRDPSHLWVVPLSGTRPSSSKASQEMKSCACISATGRRKGKRPTRGLLLVGFT